MERTLFAYVIIAAVIAVAAAVSLYFHRNSRSMNDRRRLQREDDDWRVRRAELDEDDASGD